jgi:hypothetical protein
VFSQVAGQSFGQAMLLLIVEAQLNGFVTVFFHGFALDDSIRPSQQDRDGN